MKTDVDHFADWESHFLGFGYGSGEEHVLGALKTFMEHVPDKGSYDYRKIEEALGGPTTWLLINLLGHADVIEYGTSPRFGWLTTPHGKALGAFIASATVEELESIVCNADDLGHCTPDSCDCIEGRCRNPFWRHFEQSK